MNISKYKQELWMSGAAFAWLLFTATNIDSTLGQIYLHFIEGGLIFLVITAIFLQDKSIITFQKQPGGTLKALVTGFGAWIALIIVSVFVMRFVDPTQASIGAVLKIMGATTPALANSKWANWLTFSLAVPYSETTLWARGYEMTADLLHINLDGKKFTLPITILFIVFSLAFSLFHLTAKGITNLPALTIVFIMMFISLILIQIYQETRQAIFLHAIANGIASFIALFSAGSLLFGANQIVLPLINSVPLK